MKNLFKNLMLVAVAAMAFTACQNDNNEVNNVAKETTIQFTAGFDASRSQFGEKDGNAYPSFWNGGEQVLAEVADANNDTSTTAYMEKVDEAGASANFKATFYGDYTDGTITVYAPYGNSSATSGWWNEWIDGGYQMVPQIPSTQTPNANSVEAAAHILKAEYNFDGALTSGSVDLTFEHAVAYGKMTLNLGDVVAFEDIASVRVVFGEQAYTLLRDNLTEPTFWFACKEAEVETMTITITDTNDVTYVREITTSVEKPLAFVTGQVSKFAVGGFEEVELEFVTAISASYKGSYVEFVIDTVNGSRIWLNMPNVNEGALLPECELDGDWYFESTEYGATFGTLWYVYDLYDDNKWKDYRSITEVDFQISYREVEEEVYEGYDITFWFIDSAGEEWEPFSYSGIIPGICNPPAPAPAAVNVETEAVSASGSSRYYTFAFEAGNYAFSNIWVDTLTEGLVIAEGEYSPSDAVVAYLDEEGNETGWSFDIVEGKVTVAHDTENQQYILTFELKDANGSTFTVTYVGEVEGVYAPGAATPLDAPEFDWDAKSATPTTITVAWYAVDGAASYELYYTYYADGEQTSEPVTTTATTHTFEGLAQNTNYTVYVKAVPASESNLESDYSSISVETTIDPATFETDIENVFTECVNDGNNTLTFTNAGGDQLVIPFNPGLSSISAGDYFNNWGSPYADNQSYNLNGVKIGDDSFWAVSQIFMIVAVEGDTTSISFAANLNTGETYKATFTGVIAGAGAGDFTGTELVSAVATKAASNILGGTAYIITFQNDDASVVINYTVQTQDKTYLKAMQYAYGNWSDYGYIDSVSWTGVSNPWPYTMDVEVVDEQYVITLRTNDYGNGGKAYEARFVGMVENFTLPVVEDEGGESGDGEEGQGVNATFTSAKVNAMSQYSQITLTDGEHTFFSEFNHSSISSSNKVVAGTYVFTTAFNYANFDATLTTCDGVTPTSGTINVVDNGDGTYTFTVNCVVNGNDYVGTYNGALSSL